MVFNRCSGATHPIRNESAALWTTVAPSPQALPDQTDQAKNPESQRERPELPCAPCESETDQHGKGEERNDAPIPSAESSVMLSRCHSACDYAEQPRSGTAAGAGPDLQ